MGGVRPDLTGVDGILAALGVGWRRLGRRRNLTETSPKLDRKLKLEGVVLWTAA
jgi:hypothetical protein